MSFKLSIALCNVQADLSIKINVLRLGLNGGKMEEDKNGDLYIRSFVNIDEGVVAGILEQRRIEILKKCHSERGIYGCTLILMLSQVLAIYLSYWIKLTTQYVVNMSGTC